MTSSVIGVDTQTGQHIQIPKPSRLQGLYIIGIQGTGKSGLIENLIIDDIKQGTGVCVLDPHGDLINAILARMDRRERDVILLDITDYLYPFGINFFECSDPTNPIEVQAIVDKVKHIFEKLLGVSTSTPLILDYLVKCTQTLIANPGCTMAEIPLLLQDEQCRKWLIGNVSDSDVALFWKRYEGKRSSDREEEAAGVLRRVGEFLQPLSRNIVGQSTSTIDLQNIMNEGKILMVKLSARLPSVSSLVGSILIALVLNAATNRPVNKRRQFNLYADEFQRFATEDFATLLEEARKFGIATTIAHQNRSQLNAKSIELETSLRDRTRSAANIVVFKINSKDADELAGEFNITPAPERIEEIEKEELIGQKPVRTYMGDVIGHLLKQPHKDERVTGFVKGYLHELHLASQNKIVIPNNYLGISLGADTILIGMRDLNEWLFEGMKNRDALWQPLPETMLYALARFFNFKEVYDIMYTELKFYGERESFLTKHTLDSQESANSGFGNGEWVQTAVDALENALADFLSTLFPNRSHTDIRTVWRQKAIDLTTCDFSELQARSRTALEKITSVVLKVTHAHPDLDAAAFKKQFILELSRPELAIDVFLPALFYSHHKNSFDLRDWRVPQRKYMFLPYSRSGTEVTYAYSLDLHKQGLHQAIMEELPKFIEPFQTYLGFCADLHCAQLALSQQPIITMDSGQYEQDKRTQTHYIMHSQRPYHDMLNEVASQLTNLPAFTAKVKITTAVGIEEHTIKTLDPKQQPGKPLYGQALQERLARIKEQNIQDGYVRDRAEVEKEIRQRQEQCSEPAEEEPPISRRPQH